MGPKRRCRRAPSRAVNAALKSLIENGSVAVTKRGSWKSVSMGPAPPSPLLPGADW